MSLLAVGVAVSVATSEPEPLPPAAQDWSASTADSMDGGVVFPGGTNTVTISFGIDADAVASLDDSSATLEVLVLQLAQPGGNPVPPGSFEVSLYNATWFDDSTGDYGNHILVAADVLSPAAGNGCVVQGDICWTDVTLEVRSLAGAAEVVADVGYHASGSASTPIAPQLYIDVH
ncbi:MAG: hypothetical protein H6737_28325 [Alphaproteobacteria bacterium]|nr:hypothetical protein [Alphaproteobacteria bacterium]